MNQKIFLDLFGIFCLAYAAFAIANSLLFGHASWILYYCYVSALIIGLACLMRHKNLLVSQLYIITIPVMMWQIDFYYRLLVGNSLWQMTDYFFDWSLSLASQMISLGHLIILPLAWLSLFMISGRINNAWLISLIQVFILYFLVRFFTVYVENVNCVFYSCFPLPLVPDNEWYWLSWWGINLSFILMVATLMKVFKLKSML